MNTKVIIFVIDSSDKDRIDDKNGCINNAKKELYTVLNEAELQDVILLIYANKQDMNDVMNEDEIIERLELDTIKHINWKVQPSSARNGDGLHKGLDWIHKQFKKKYSRNRKERNKKK